MRGSFSLQKYSRLKKDTEVGMVELEYHHFITSSEVMYLENISVLAKKSNLRQIKPQTLQIYKHSRNRRTCHVTRQRGSQQTVGNNDKGQPFPTNTLKEKGKGPLGKRDVRKMTTCDVLKLLAFCSEQYHVHIHAHPCAQAHAFSIDE